MALNKIIRSVCYFSDEITPEIFQRLQHLNNQLLQNGFEIQTHRLCLSNTTIQQASEKIDDPNLFVGLGSKSYTEAREQFDYFVADGNYHFNLDITSGVTLDDVTFLFDIIQSNASKTFNFTYAVNIPPSSPFFPSANYEQSGFSIGLQSTDLSAGCASLEEWFDTMQTVWDEIVTLFADDPDFLGIDSSVAPLFSGDSSFVALIERLHMPFPQAVTTYVFTRISEFIKTKNPKPIGLCGLMFPCLEDAGLADYYAEGEFSLERNIFLSLHCGLGIDTYPIGVDENPERVLAILQLLRALSNRYQKPLSARFISDGQAKIGEKTDLQNQYLQDVVVRAL